MNEHFHRVGLVNGIAHATREMLILPGMPLSADEYDE